MKSKLYRPGVFLFRSLLIIGFISIAFTLSMRAQAIFAPEGLNMPGAWAGWSNPPAVFALAGASQTPAGQLYVSAAGTRRYHTTISCAASGGDVTAGSYEFLFTSGPATNYYNNKWGGTTVVMNSLQTYTFGSGTNNSITVANGKWYTMNFKDNGYTNTTAVFMETSGAPVTITDVSSVYAGAGTDVPVTVTISAPMSAEEHVFVRYTTDGWASSGFAEATGSGTTLTATIPGASVTGAVTNKFYVMTTTFASPTHADADLQTINLSNHGGINYSLPVEMTSFSATVKHGAVMLAWNTATEVNNVGFDIERKPAADAGAWEKIAFVRGHGTTNAANAYAYTDNAPEGIFLYRLKQIDADGKFKYSTEAKAAIIVSGEALLQNYPNPFNPTTMISYRVASTGKVVLSVFDLLGKEVVRLVDGMNEPGRHTVSFNAGALPSGVYFYRLQADGATTIRKLTLFK